MWPRFCCSPRGSGTLFCSRAPTPPAWFSINPDAAVAFLHRVRRQPAANRCARRRAVDQIEASVVLRALNHSADHQSIGKMRVAMRTESIGRKKSTLRITIERIRLAARDRSGPYLHAAIRLPHTPAPSHPHPAPLPKQSTIRARAASAQAADASRDMPGPSVCRRIVWKNLAPCGKDWRTASGSPLDSLVQPGQRVIRHQRKHVVLDVVVHVPVEIADDRIHVHGAAVEPMIEHVLSQAGVLRVAHR